IPGRRGLCLRSQRAILRRAEPRAAEASAASAGLGSAAQGRRLDLRRARPLGRFGAGRLGLGLPLHALVPGGRAGRRRRSARVSDELPPHPVQLPGGSERPLRVERRRRAAAPVPADLQRAGQPQPGQRLRRYGPARHHVRAALRFGRSGILRAAGILLGAAPDAPGAGAEILTICCIRSTDRYRFVWRLSCGWAWSPALRYWRSRSTATTSRATSGWIRSNGGAMTSTATTYAPPSRTGRRPRNRATPATSGTSGPRTRTASTSR